MCERWSDRTLTAVAHVKQQCAYVSELELSGQQRTRKDRSACASRYRQPDPRRHNLRQRINGGMLCTCWLYHNFARSNLQHTYQGTGRLRCKVSNTATPARTLRHSVQGFTTHLVAQITRETPQARPTAVATSGRYSACRRRRSSSSIHNTACFVCSLRHSCEHTSTHAHAHTEVMTQTKIMALQ